MQDKDNKTSFIRSQKIKQQREEISKKPYWRAMFKEASLADEIRSMAKYYDDIDGIIEAGRKLPLGKLPTYLFKFESDSGCEQEYERWDEDLQCLNKFTANYPAKGSKVGLIQQALVAAVRQSKRTEEEIFHLSNSPWKMVPPCDLDIDIEGAGCRLLWGRTCYSIRLSSEFFEYDFFMTGRELLVSVIYDEQAAFYGEETRGNEEISVTLLRGEPLDHPCWGTLANAHVGKKIPAKFLRTKNDFICRENIEPF